MGKYIIQSPDRIAGPAVTAVLAFSAGIMLGTHMPCHALVITGFIITCATFSICSGNKSSDIAVLLLLAGTGYTAVCIEHTISRPMIIERNSVGSAAVVEGRICESAVHRYGSAYFTLNCESIQYDGAHATAASGKLPCVVYDTPQQTSMTLTGGTNIRLRGIIKRIRSPLRRISNSSSPYRLTVKSHETDMSVIVRGNSLFETIRRRLINAVTNAGYGDNTSLLLAMTIGARDMIPDDIRDDFSRAGLAHLLAVSGLHAGIIAVALFFLLKHTHVKRIHATIILATCMFFYAGICGFRAPVTRAAFMMTAIACTKLLQRRVNPENILASALLVILALNPSALFMPSLQLSFAAVWCILHVYSAVEPAFPPGRTSSTQFWSRLLLIAIISATAWIATFPLSSLYFGQISLIGVPANVIVSFLIGPTVLSGLAGIITAAAGPFFRPLAVAALTFTDTCLALIRGIAAFTASLPFSSFEIRFEAFWVLMFFVWLVILSRAVHRPAWRKGAVYCALAILCTGGWHAAAQAMYPARNRAEVIFFDVGQGDAACVRTKHHAFLIDTGPRYNNYDAGKALIIPSLKALGIKKLDAVIISHLHSDHTGGLESVLRAMPVDRVFCHELALEKLSAGCSVETMPLSAGDSLAFHDGGAFVLSPYKPSPDVTTAKNAVENNRSLVIRFDIGGGRLLFTGDIEHNPQSALTAWSNRLAADILKMPHHGAGGLDNAFLRVTAPSEAIISCGTGNRYGHPSPETVSMLDKAGIVHYRTDIDGPVIVTLNGTPGHEIETR